MQIPKSAPAEKPGKKNFWILPEVTVMLLQPSTDLSAVKENFGPANNPKNKKEF